VCVRVRVCVRVCVRVHVHVCVRMCVHVHVCVCFEYFIVTSPFSFTYVCACACVCVCVCFEYFIVTPPFSFLTSNHPTTFFPPSPDHQAHADRAFVKEQVLNAARGFFRPEFMNRLDAVLVFDPLSEVRCQRVCVWRLLPRCPSCALC